MVHFENYWLSINDWVQLNRSIQLKLHIFIPKGYTRWRYAQYFSIYSSSEFMDCWLLSNLQNRRKGYGTISRCCLFCLWLSMVRNAPENRQNISNCYGCCSKTDLHAWYLWHPLHQWNFSKGDLNHFFRFFLLFK